MIKKIEKPEPAAQPPDYRKQAGADRKNQQDPRQYLKQGGSKIIHARHPIIHRCKTAHLQTANFEEIDTSVNFLHRPLS